jgi:hypothetical protein
LETNNQVCQIQQVLDLVTISKGYQYVVELGQKWLRLWNSGGENYD